MNFIILLFIHLKIIPQLEFLHYQNQSNIAIQICDTMTRRTVTTEDGNTIEYYFNGINNDKLPLIISMGNWEPAFRGFHLMNSINDRPCVVLSYRGRGGSSSPLKGYDWKDHSHDLKAVIKDCEFNKCIFLAFSKGVSYTLGFIESNPEVAAGLILIDYPAIHCNSTPGYAEFWYNMKYLDYKLKDHITLTALQGIEKESTEKEFYETIKSLKCPITVFVGRNKKSERPSNIEENDIIKYKEANPSVKFKNFEKSGHMILDEEFELAKNEVHNFLKSID